MAKRRNDGQSALSPLDPQVQSGKVRPTTAAQKEGPLSHGD